MWSENKQQKLNELQQRETENALNAEEKRELEKLLSELEKAEWDLLQPAIEHKGEEENQLQAELSRVKTQNTVLAAIAARQNDLAKRAAAYLKNLQTEHEDLKNERARVLHDLAA